MVLIMSFERKKILIEFCNSNTFTDSEDDSSDEELSKECNVKENVVIQQPGSDKITIIIDTSDIIQYKKEEHDHDWENIEYTDLEDIVFDYSLNEVIKEKYL
tara:strand:- start:3613 stop:3918 length:306 start_codon:yes stop_codon:yes gene_type:complete